VQAERNYIDGKPRPKRLIAAARYGLLDDLMDRHESRSLQSDTNLFVSAFRRRTRVPEILEPVLVKELGWKLRWVTRMKAETVRAQKRMQMRSFPNLLKKVSSVRRGLKKEGALCTGPSHPAYYPYVYSLDASKATDKMSRSAFQLCLSAVNQPMPTFMIDRKIMTIGSPMGMPINWVLLNILHESSASFSFDEGAYALCGDDFIGLGSDQDFSLYLSKNSTFGLVPKPESIIRSTVGGIFCERLYIRKDVDQCRILEEAPIWGSTRMLVSNEMLFEVEHQRYSPQCLLVGPSTFEKLGKFPHMREVLRPLVDMARRFKINPYLPIQMGGLGIRPPDMSKRLKTSEEVLATALINGHASPLNLYSLETGRFGWYTNRAKSEILKNLKWRHLPPGHHLLEEGVDYVDLKFESRLGAAFSKIHILALSEGFIPESKSIGRREIFTLLNSFRRKIPKFVFIKPLKWTYEGVYAMSGNLYPTLASMDQALIGELEPEA
jgi:hypothetical protein